MGKENTISYGDKSIKSNKNNKQSFLPVNQSAISYGIVVSVDAKTKSVVYNTIENNIGSQRLGNAIPLYKNNSTVPQVGDVIPLVRGPQPSTGVLGNMYNKAFYYLDPISIDQELSQNTLTRISTPSGLPSDIDPSVQDYKTTDIGFAKVTRGDNSGTVLTSQSGVGGYTTYNYKNSSKLPNGSIIKTGYIITIPKLLNSETNIAIVWGGMGGFGAKWMMDKIPDIYKSNKIFVFAEREGQKGTNTYYDSTITYITQNFPGRLIGSVSGFSAGGLEVWKAIGKHNFIGLIDPSTDDYSYPKAISSPNVIMYYRPRNWVSVGNYGSNQRKAAATMNKDGNYAYYVDTNLQLKLNPKLSDEKADGEKSNHLQIPDIFIRDYGGRF